MTIPMSRYNVEFAKTLQAEQIQAAERSRVVARFRKPRHRMGERSRTLRAAD
jgi:hypothetical protein